MSGNRRLLLVSNSTQHGRSYLKHVADAIRQFLGPARRVLFVPYALFDRDAYGETARQRFASLGYELESIHTARDTRRAIEKAEALFVGGGNTFRLLKALYDNGIIDVIRRRVDTGMPYIGSSAGTVVACPTMCTTNDMPIVEPPSLKALGLVDFQINCHYLDADPSSTHMGETREERLLQFLEENPGPVVGLREGCWLTVTEGETSLHGGGARIFRRGQPPDEVKAGSVLGPHLRSG